MERQRVLECSSLCQHKEGCSNTRGTEMVAIVQDGTKRFAAVREVGSCCSSAKVVEGALDSGRESFSIKSVSSLIGMLVVGWISYFSVTELQCGSG